MWNLTNAAKKKRKEKTNFNFIGHNYRSDGLKSIVIVVYKYIFINKDYNLCIVG